MDPILYSSKDPHGKGVLNGRIQNPVTALNGNHFTIGGSNFVGNITC